jgi:hypothetical protein
MGRSSWSLFIYPSIHSSSTLKIFNNRENPFPYYHHRLKDLILHTVNGMPSFYEEKLQHSYVRRGDNLYIFFTKEAST